MNELESLQNSAFTIAKNIIEHIEKKINEYMQENGEYSEMETIDGRECFLIYKKKVFHRFRYNALGVIYYQ